MSEAPESDWYLREWMAHLHKRQADLVNERGWDKAKASFIFNSKQQYRRDLVNELAAWLGLRPYELLMPPEEALELRQIRLAAKAIARLGTPPAAEAPPAPPAPAQHRGPRRRTGTTG